MEPFCSPSSLSENDAGKFEAEIRRQRGTIQVVLNFVCLQMSVVSVERRIVTTKERRFPKSP